MWADENVTSFIFSIDLNHKSVDQFSRGSSQPIKLLYSHKDDVFLADPFGLVVAGWARAVLQILADLTMN